MTDYEQKLRNILPIIRDIVLLVGGLGIALNEAIFTAGERPSILILAAAMMGLPIWLRKDGGGTGPGDN